MRSLLAAVLISLSGPVIAHNAISDDPGMGTSVGLTQPIFTPSGATATAGTCKLPSEHIVAVPVNDALTDETETACAAES